MKAKTQLASLMIQ